MQSNWLDVSYPPIKRVPKCTALSITRQHKITRASEFPVKSPKTLIKHRENCSDKHRLAPCLSERRLWRQNFPEFWAAVGVNFKQRIAKIGQVVTSWRCFVIIFIDHTWRGPYWTRCMQIDKQWWTRGSLRRTKVEKRINQSKDTPGAYNLRWHTRDANFDFLVLRDSEVHHTQYVPRTCDVSQWSF